VPLEVPVSILVEGQVVEGVSEDISTSGLFVRTERLVRSGRRVALRFDLPQGAVEVSAVVVRFRTPSKGMPAGIGLCFEELSEQQSECIEEFADAAVDSIH
jgi:uncharacterized protein (TIGR02266 family)